MKGVECVTVRPHLFNVLALAVGVGFLLIGGNAGAAPAPGTSVVLTSSLNPSYFGQAVTFTATVTPSAATGTMTFSAGLNTEGVAAVTGGVATLTTSALSLGTHTMGAVYSGDSFYPGSSAPTIIQTVNDAPVSTPTLNGWGMLAFGPLSALAALFFLRRLPS